MQGCIVATCDTHTCDVYTQVGQAASMRPCIHVDPMRSMCLLSYEISSVHCSRKLRWFIVYLAEQATEESRVCGVVG